MQRSDLFRDRTGCEMASFHQQACTSSTTCHLDCYMRAELRLHVVWSQAASTSGPMLGSVTSQQHGKNLISGEILAEEAVCMSRAAVM